MTAMKDADSYVATIARVHVAAGLLNPCSSEAVRLGLKKMGRETLGSAGPGSPLGLEGHQGVHRRRRRVSFGTD
jgi:hypothetical protein